MQDLAHQIRRRLQGRPANNVINAWPAGSPPAEFKRVGVRPFAALYYRAGRVQPMVGIRWTADRCRDCGRRIADRPWRPWDVIGAAVLVALVVAVVRSCGL